MTDTLASLLHASVQRTPDNAALVHRDTRLSYGALWEQASIMAGLLRASGLRPGAHVALLLDNSPVYAIAYYGVMLAGGVVVALNTASRARDLANWIRHSESQWLIASHRHPELRSLVVQLGTSIRWIDTGPADACNTPEPYARWTAIVTDGGLRGELPGQPAAAELAAIIYTSGTTGQPKGVMLSHRNLCANTRSILSYLDLTSGDSVMNVLPFHYSYGNSVLHTHLAVGASVVLENSLLYPHEVVATMAAARVTGFAGVPSTFSLLLQRVRLADYDLSNLRYATQAGGPMTAAAIRQWRSALPHTRFFVMYGQTEASARLTYLPPAMLDSKMGSVGVAIPGVSIRVVDRQGNPVPPGSVGEIQARGENIMLGYWKDGTSTAACIADGWLRTGDLASCDEDGYLYLAGRTSDMIKCGANRISPAEIEEILLELEGVEEVAAVGIPDAILGQSIKAVVVLASGYEPDARRIKRHCREHLAGYKVPKIIEFARAIPKTATGKVQRFRLQDAPE
ncbi:MAG: class I adenylate-forming enzyme family protein [Pseudomonadota bacterium]